MNLLAIHPEQGLALDGQPLVRLCGQPFQIPAEQAPNLLDSELLVGGFTSPAEGGPVMISYTTWVEGTDPAALGLAAASIADTTLRLADPSAAELDALRPVVEPSRVDVRAMLLAIGGGEKVFRSRGGVYTVQVMVEDSGVQLAAAPAEGAVEVTIRMKEALGREPLVSVSAAMHAIEAMPPVAMQLLATVALTRAATLQLGSFRLAEGRLVFGYDALGSSLTPQRLLRLVSFVGETAVAMTTGASVG